MFRECECPNQEGCYATCFIIPGTKWLLLYRWSLDPNVPRFRVQKDQVGGSTQNVVFVRERSPSYFGLLRMNLSTLKQGILEVRYLQEYKLYLWSFSSTKTIVSWSLDKRFVYIYLFIWTKLNTWILNTSLNKPPRIFLCLFDVKRFVNYLTESTNLRDFSRDKVF